MGVQIMFDQANSFYICSKLCKRELNENSGSNDLFAIPRIVNLTFACEVYLKTLLASSKTNVEKKHRLNDLYDALPDEDRFFIETYMETRYPLRDVFGSRFIDVEADDFVAWRYIYEKDTLSCDIGYLEALAETLQELCCMRIYELSWKRYCKTANINSDLWG